MVAPCTLGRIARSMVRVPGSGIAADSVPICLNLGNVSQVAAMVHVPQSLVTIGSRDRRRHPMISSFSFNGSANQKLAGETVTSQGTSLSTGDVIKTLPLLDDSASFSNRTDVQTGGDDARDGFPVAAPTAMPRESVAERSPRPNKRPIRQDSTEDAEENRPSKRYRGVSAIAASRPIDGSTVNISVSTSSSGYATATMPLSLGTRGTKVNIPSSTSTSPSSIPVVMQVVTSNGQQLSLPIGLAQANSGTAPTFVLQAVPTQATTTVYLPVLVASAKNRLPGSPTEPKGALQKMVLERDHLKLQNESLKYRLFRFHQLMRNKQQLISVIRHLNAVPS